MKNMKTITRNIYNPATKEIEARSFKIHVCEGTSSYSGKPCRSAASNHVGNGWYCNFHHPDKSKRRIAPATLVLQRTGKTANGFTPKKPKKNFTWLQKKEETTPTTPPITTNPGADFALSLKQLVELAAKQAVREMLEKLFN